MDIINLAQFNYHFDGQDYTEESSATIVVDTPVIITISKTASPEKVESGDTVTYFVTISLNNYTGTITNQVFRDIIPDTLEFVEGSLTLDAEPISGNISNLTVSFEPNTEHLIVYQCKVL